jgi:isopenicillin-N epimerase
MKDLFLLDPEITYLNFGSFGACPRPIFEDYITWQYLLEKDPVHFITESGPEFLKTSKLALAEYLNCMDGDLIFTPNPTYALNLVIRSLKLKKDDEVLATNLEYGALDKTWKYYLKQIGAKYIQSEIQLPIKSKEEFLENFWKGFTTKTKIIFISHITSATGLILPVKEICIEAKKRGLITIIDGAHVPGHIHLDLSDLDPDFYSGACHKWMMTPKGCSFLFAKSSFHESLEPFIVSWGYDNNLQSNRFHEFQQFNGTRDFSAYLTIPAALNFMREYNWNQKSAACKTLLLRKAPEVFDAIKCSALAPLNNDFFGQLCSFEISCGKPNELKRLLHQKYKIQIPVIETQSMTLIRFSIQAFNTESDIDKLIDVLLEIGLNQRS